MILDGYRAPSIGCRCRDSPNDPVPNSHRPQTPWPFLFGIRFCARIHREAPAHLRMALGERRARTFESDHRADQAASGEADMKTVLAGDASLFPMQPWPLEKGIDELTRDINLQGFTLHIHIMVICEPAVREIDLCFTV
jgi:hypothetical protein